MNVRVNGEGRAVERAANVLEFLNELGLGQAPLLVEHNGVALRRDEWPATPISDGDRIELVRIVAGG